MEADELFVTEGDLDAAHDLVETVDGAELSPAYGSRRRPGLGSGTDMTWPGERPERASEGASP